MSSFQEINRPLISVKLLLLCWFAALSTAPAYMTIYLKNMGISAQTTAFITSLYPLSRLIGPSISGPIADRIGRYKPILYTSFSVQILMTTSFLIIPNFQQMGVNSPCMQQNNSNATSKIESHSIVCTHICSENETFEDCQMLYKDDDCLCQVEPTANRTIDKLRCIGNSSCLCSSFDKCVTNASMPYVTTNIFVLLLFSYAIYQLFIAVSYAMVEATTLAMVKEHNTNYGKQRVWAIIGLSIFAPLSGFLVDYVSMKKGYTDYSPVFYTFNALTILNIICVYNINLKRIPPSQNILRDILSLLRKQRVCLFLSSLMFQGIFYGFIESYLFWYMQEFGSPKYLMGLTLTLSGLCALPLSHLSHRIINKFGCVSLITVTFFISSACFLAYSYLSNPWLMALVQIPDSAFYHLMWISAATHSSKLVKDNLLASIQSAMVSSHFGLGRGIGTLSGGSLIYAYGEPASFRCVGVAAGIIGLIYSILYCYSERSSKKCLLVPKSDDKDHKVYSTKKEDVV